MREGARRGVLTRVSAKGRSASPRRICRANRRGPFKPVIDARTGQRPERVAAPYEIGAGRDR